MSHLHEREEKVCLNCEAELIGRYCHKCGQENVEPRESTWHLIVHFFNDVTHFEGKFFTTLKPLLFKPGFLTEEYVKGHRARYINPIRMYLFISAAFFLGFMSIMTAPEEITTKDTHKKDHAKGIVQLKSADTTVDLDKDKNALSRIFTNTIDKNGPQTLSAYDSQQHALPKAERDGFINRYYTRRFYAAVEYGRLHPDAVAPQFKSNFFHSLPKIFFISLPLFASLLALLYIRRRKQFYFVSHVIFTVHIYCFSFILWIIVMFTYKMPFIGGWIGALTPLVIFFYLYKAMRYFYKQRRAKTIIKFILMYFGIGILVFALAVGHAINSFLNIAVAH